MSDQAGRIDLDGRIDDGADDALGPDTLPDRSAGIDCTEPLAFKHATRLVEIPPGHAVLHGDYGCPLTQQRRDLLKRRRQRMRLQRQHDIVLHAEFLGARRRPHPRDRFLAVLDQAKAIGLDRLQMRAARHDRQLD